MKNGSDRVKNWRERRKAEGKASVTVLLSQEVRNILREEKEKTGESYAVIIERALLNLRKISLGSYASKHVGRCREGKSPNAAAPWQVPSQPATDSRSDTAPRPLLIDDLADYGSLEGGNSAKTGQDRKEGPVIESKEGLFPRLFRITKLPFRRRQTNVQRKTKG